MNKFLIVLHTCVFVFGLFLISSLAGFDQAGSEEIPIRERLISIDVQDQDFTQAMETIAGQVGVRIDIHGQKPSGRRDISFEQVPLGQAMAQMMKMYGVRNHAAAYHSEVNSIILITLGAKTMTSALNDNEIKDAFFEDQMTHMTQEDFSLLIAVDQREPSKGMTVKEMLLLEPASEENMKGMSSEEFSALESFGEDNFRGMTLEELESLDSGYVENFNEITDEEFSRLR